ncbi:MAG: hypothetical protein HFJ69_03710, partial [Enterorhabdus sp.]|nr:hypothetical protein [Enterorhabdus sp.]
VAGDGLGSGTDNAGVGAAGLQVGGRHVGGGLRGGVGGVGLYAKKQPADMFGKVMSIPDELMVKYYRLASTESVDEIDAIEAGLAADELHPNKVKRALARNIVAAYHGNLAAEEAEAAFDLVFKQHAVPEDIAEFAADLTPNDEGLVYVARLIHQAGLASSVSEARSLIDQGGVKVNGEALAPKAYNVEPALLEGAVIQVGKRKFVRLV